MSGEAEEQSMKDLMKNMGEMLRSLNARVGMIEGAAASHTINTVLPNGCSMQMTGQVAAPTAPMEAEMQGPLPDVSDAMRAQVTRRL